VRIEGDGRSGELHEHADDELGSVASLFEFRGIEIDDVLVRPAFGFGFVFPLAVEQEFVRPALVRRSQLEQGHRDVSHFPRADVMRVRIDILDLTGQDLEAVLLVFSRPADLP
jgi:hypothetical protein